MILITIINFRKTTCTECIELVCDCKVTPRFSYDELGKYFSLVFS